MFLILNVAALIKDVKFFYIILSSVLKTVAVF